VMGGVRDRTWLDRWCGGRHFQIVNGRHSGHSLT
jgi:hypothetical protein